MPDYFVPLDTSMNSQYFRDLFYNNVIREFTLKYYEKNRSRLEKMNFESYKSDFSVSEKMLNEIIQLGEKANIPLDKDGLNKSKDLIKLRVKAQIARSVWNNEGYFPVYNQSDEVFQKALNLFDQAKELASN